MSPLNGFLLSTVVAHVCLANKSSMTKSEPLQIFKLALAFLAETNFAERKVIFGRSGSVELTEEERLAGLKLFVDRDPLDSSKTETPSLSYNIWWSVQLSLDVRVRKPAFV